MVYSVCVRSLLALSFALIHASEPKVSLYIILAVSAYATLVLGVVRPLWWKVVDRVRQHRMHMYMHTYHKYMIIYTHHTPCTSAQCCPPPLRPSPFPLGLCV